jgi:hypothetical protein
MDGYLSKPLDSRRLWALVEDGADGDGATFDRGMTTAAV